MTDRNGPWREEEPGGNAGGVVLWVALLAALGIGIWMLAERFPDALAAGENQGRLLYLVALLALVSSGVIFARRFTRREVLRNLAGWGAIAIVLALAFTYQAELQTVASRVRSELIPGYAVSSDPQTLTLTEAGGGHFLVMAEANGVPVRFLIDTGASDVVLSPAAARAIGIDLNTLRFTRVFNTANGTVRGAPYNLASLKVGKIELANVPVSVNQAEMDVSLLGMTFLNRLESFEFRGRQLHLRTR
jgi:aspartyl protease family protein